jgi:hypothetical protein
MSDNTTQEVPFRNARLLAALVARTVVGEHQVPELEELIRAARRETEDFDDEQFEFWSRNGEFSLRVNPESW